MNKMLNVCKGLKGKAKCAQPMPASCLQVEHLLKPGPGPMWNHSRSRSVAYYTLSEEETEGDGIQQGAIHGWNVSVLSPSGHCRRPVDRILTLSMTSILSSLARTRQAAEIRGARHNISALCRTLKIRKEQNTWSPEEFLPVLCPAQGQLHFAIRHFRHVNGQDQPLG